MPALGHDRVRTALGEAGCRELWGSTSRGGGACDGAGAAGKRARPTCLELTRIWWETDVRAVLPSVHVPTLLMIDDGEAERREVAELSLR